MYIFLNAISIAILFFVAGMTIIGVFIYPIMLLSYFVEHRFTGDPMFLIYAPLFYIVMVILGVGIKASLPIEYQIN